jgi:hypothetical protein
MLWLRVVSVIKWGSPELPRGVAELRAKFVVLHCGVSVAFWDVT